MTTDVLINPRRVIGRRDEKIYGHFLEHFHRQIYGGVYDPGSPFSDDWGFRADVIQALNHIGTPVIRWPGGCYVSAYHWKDGVGASRTPAFDKAWRVEESNLFGTDEFVEYCRRVGAEPYLCTNAGSGSPEEMSDWVEYCNLKSEGKWARLRIDNGHRDPYGVKYWSIGNENYLPGEIGAKTPGEWGRFVKESAKMMKRVDPSIEILAASVNDIDWNTQLLKEAGTLLDWISIHGYWDPLWQNNALSGYEDCMAFSTAIEDTILKAEHILGSMGFLGRIRIAMDEWNLRGWHHPNVDTGTTPEEYLLPRDKNDVNESYTMADAVFSACFLNQCLKHCNTVGMANFAPVVNTRGAVFTHPGGTVLRPTYFVFDLYANLMGDTVLDSWIPECECFEASPGGKAVPIHNVDVLATADARTGAIKVSLVNRHPDRNATVRIALDTSSRHGSARLFTLAGESKDSCNTVSHPGSVKIEEQAMQSPEKNPFTLEIPPHSVNILVLE